MTDFVDISILSTMIGCSAIITLLTQIWKKYLPNSVDPKWIALVDCIIIGILRIFFVGQFDFAGIVSGILNIFVLLGTSIGIYEIGKSVKGGTK